MQVQAWRGVPDQSGQAVGGIAVHTTDVDIPAVETTNAGAAQRPEIATRRLLSGVLKMTYPGRIALVSSFGAESAVLLHLVASIDPDTPVIFLDTGKLFPETLAYRDRLILQLGLTAVRSVQPSRRALAMADPAGTLWQADPDTCCWHRKTEPLAEALAGFDAWITGRKRFQGGQRGALPEIEHEPDGKVKVNPLVGWSPEQLARYAAENALPAHPLAALGYRSIGCAPCTQPTRPGEDARAGRWASNSKTECGIHLARLPNPTPSDTIQSRSVANLTPSQPLTSDQP